MPHILTFPSNYEFINGLIYIDEVRVLMYLSPLDNTISWGPSVKYMSPKEYASYANHNTNY
jgi:hypothetical protein